MNPVLKTKTAAGQEYPQLDARMQRGLAEHDAWVAECEQKRREQIKNTKPRKAKPSESTE